MSDEVCLISMASSFLLYATYYTPSMHRHVFPNDDSLLGALLSTILGIQDIHSCLDKLHAPPGALSVGETCPDTFRSPSSITSRGPSSTTSRMTPHFRSRCLGRHIRPPSCFFTIFVHIKKSKKIKKLKIKN